MCAIVGIIPRQQSHWQNHKWEELATLMLNRQRHRGRIVFPPVHIGSVWLGCCRLPVVDRDHGQQPVSNKNGKICAVFNGEIYNHIELRQKITDCAFPTQCDSELIPYLYEKNRHDPHKIHDLIRGMYAIGIYDSENHQTILFRDPLGKKPLFVYEAEDHIGFASEAKAFGEKPKTWELRPGETVIIKGGHIAHHLAKSIWHEQVPQYFVTDMKEAAEKIRLCVEDAVKCRLPTDLDVAVLCSGGIDSMIIAYLARCFTKKKAKAYVIGTANSADVHAATIACGALDIPLEAVIIDEGMLTSVVAEVVYHTESFEPNIVRNSLISYRLFERIRNDDYRVALCGEGADELFFGYADFEQESDKTNLMASLLDDLYRTQLLRVDRTSMAFNLETRVPFLDRSVVNAACGIDPKLKETHIYDLWQGKAVLRQAFRDVLPLETVTRSKATFSYGAGFGDVSMSNENPIEYYAKRILKKENAKDRLQETYKNIDLSTFERALYMYYYEQFYQVPSDYTPPKVAQKEIRRDSRSAPHQ